MIRCPKCKTEYYDNEKNKLRNCKYCNEIIGCINCLVPGTLEYHYCDFHRPGTKKDTSYYVQKYINDLLTNDEKIHPYCVYELIKIGKKGTKDLINAFHDVLNKNKEKVVQELLYVFGKIDDDNIVKELEMFVDKEYKEDSFQHSTQAIVSLLNLAYVGNMKAVEVLKNLSQHSSPKIKEYVLRVFDAEENSANEELKKIYTNMLNGRKHEDVVKIYILINNFKSYDYRIVEGAIKESVYLDNEKELVQSLNHYSSMIVGNAIRCLAMKKNLSNEAKEKIFEAIKNCKKDVYIVKNILYLLASLKEYEKILDYINNKELNLDNNEIKSIGVDILLSNEEAKNFLNRINDEYCKRYIENEEFRYTENVRIEISERLNRAKNFIIYKKYPDAIFELQEILKINPKDYNANLNLAKIYTEIYDYKNAEKHANVMLELIKTEEEKGKNVEDVIKDNNSLQSKITKEDKVECYAIAGDINVVKGLIDKAIEFYKKVIEIEVNNKFILKETRNKLSTIYILRGMFEEAISEFRKCIELSTDTNEEVKYRKNIAEILRNMGKNKEAMDEYKILVDNNTADEEVYLYLYNYLSEEKNENEAEEILRKAIKLYSNDVEIVMSFVSLLIMKNRFGEAEKIIKSLFQNNPEYAHSKESAKLHLILGGTLINQNKTLEAKKEIELAEKLDPKIKDEFMKKGFNDGF